MPLRLVYFDFAGRAEPVRWALAIGGVDFDDVRVSREEFAKGKEEGKYPFGQLPVLEVQGKVVAQSQAILRYAGRLSGLYPDDPFEALLVDEMVGAVEDVIQATVPSLREPDEAKKMAMREELASKIYPKWFALLSEKLEAAGGDYFVGGKLTIADLQAAQTLSWVSSGMLDGVPPSVMEPFPLLKGLIDRVNAQPKIAEWNEAHPPTPMRK